VVDILTWQSVHVDTLSGETDTHVSRKKKQIENISKDVGKAMTQSLF
jgi:hypothetical protein